MLRFLSTLAWLSTCASVYKSRLLLRFSMTKRKRNHSAPPSSAREGLSAQTFPCSSSGLVVMLFFPGDRYCFYGTARVQCLGGDFFVDDFKMPTGGNLELESMRHVCAPYRLSRPAVFRSILPMESPTKYKLNRLRYRLKEITLHYERIMDMIGERYPAVVVIDRKPSQTIRVMDQVLQDFFVPSWLRSPCQFDRTLFFSSQFELYTDDTQVALEQAMEEVNTQRVGGRRCTVVPVGTSGSGKSTLVRHLINTNLTREWSVVYLLDADVGQSEFTPAGCMSLWRLSDAILDVPCTHQSQKFSCSYFFGNISPADDTEKYKELFDRLLNEFQSSSEPGALLVINTLGWIEGLGLELLQHIFDVSRPLVAVSLSQERGASIIPPWVPIVVRVAHKFPPNHSYLKLPDGIEKPARLLSNQLRDFALVSYLSYVLPRPDLSSLCDTTPYCVKFDRVTICVPEDYSYVDDRYFLATLNVQIVALCSHEGDEPLKTRRLLGIHTLPLVFTLASKSPILRCHGYGIVRAIDLEKKLFYVITPTPSSELSKVTIFARVTDLPVPQVLVEAQPVANVLYLSRPALSSKSSGIITDLYGGLKNVKTGKRAYFPAHAH